MYRMHWINVPGHRWFHRDILHGVSNCGYGMDIGYRHRMDGIQQLL